MAQTIKVTALVAGADTNDFIIRESSISGSIVASGVTRAQLLSGYDVTIADNNVTQVVVSSGGLCPNTVASATFFSSGGGPTPVPVPAPIAPVPAPVAPIPTPQPQPVPAPVTPAPVVAPVVPPVAPTLYYIATSASPAGCGVFQGSAYWWADPFGYLTGTQEANDIADSGEQVYGGSNYEAWSGTTGTYSITEPGTGEDFTQYISDTGIVGTDSSCP